jgi:hypothetical protein
LEISVHIETTRPENSDHTILLQAADALELVEAQIEKWMDALRYFVDLGSDNRPRDFADVKRNLTNTYALIKSSDLILLRVRELAARFRALATEEATRRSSIPKSNEQPAVPLDPGSIQKAHDEQTQVDVVLSEVEIPVEEPSTDSQPLDSGPAQEEQHEQRGDMVLSEVEVPVEEPSTDSQPTPAQKEQDEQERIGVMLSEVDVSPEEPSADSPPLDTGSSQKEQDEQKRVDMVLSEIEALFREASTGRARSQPY